MQYLSHYVIIFVTEQTGTEDLGPVTQDPGTNSQNLRHKIQIQDSGPGMQEFRSRTNNPYLGPEIYGQGLVSMLRTVLAFLARMVFIISKYSL